MTIDANDIAMKYGLEGLRRANEAAALAEEQEGAALLDAVHEFLTRFIAYPQPEAAIAHALWIAHTHLMEAWYCTPRIAFLSPEPQSGKTRAIEVTTTLVPEPIHTFTVSPAYLYRRVGDEERAKPTILFDETDAVFGSANPESEPLRSIINAGHRRGAFASRCAAVGNGRFVPEDIPAFCAVALAGLGDLPQTILSRSIVIRMRRRAPNETVAAFRQRKQDAEGNALRDRLAAWAATRVERLKDVEPQMPEGIVDRNADIWEPLFAVADEAGGGWPERARAAAVALVARVTAFQEDQGSMGIRLLKDLKRVFGEENNRTTESLLQELVKLPESPWADIRGKPLDSRGLANRLRQYEIKSKSMRVEGGFARGYARADLHDAWRCYLPPSPAEAITSVTSGTVAADGDV